MVAPGEEENQHEENRMRDIHIGKRGVETTNEDQLCLHHISDDLPLMQRKDRERNCKTKVVLDGRKDQSVKKEDATRYRSACKRPVLGPGHVGFGRNCKTFGSANM